MAATESYPASPPTSPVVAEALNRSAKISKVILDASRSKDGGLKIDSIWQRLHSPPQENQQLNNNNDIGQDPSEPDEIAPSSPLQVGREEVPKIHRTPLDEGESSQRAPFETTAKSNHSQPKLSSWKSSKPEVSESQRWERSTRPPRDSDLTSKSESSTRNLDNSRDEFFPDLALETDALTLKQEKVWIASFGVGLQVSTEVPHTVQGVKQVILARNTGNKIAIGDELFAVSGQVVEMAGINVVESLISGEENTEVTLSLRSNASGQLYDVVLLRHIKLRESERTNSWYELKDGVTALTATLAIVRYLEEIRALLYDFNHELKYHESSLGFTVSEIPCINRIRYVIEEVIEGTSAHVEGGLISGDEITAIDGIHLEDLAEPSISENLKGRGVVGSKCMLTVERNGKTRQIELCRSSKSCVGQAAQLFAALKIHSDVVERSSSGDEVVKSLQILKQTVQDIQRYRLRDETAFASRLYSIERRIFSLLSEAEKCLAPSALRSEGASVTLKHYRPFTSSLPVSQSVPQQETADMYLEEIDNLKAEISQKTELVRLQAAELKGLRSRLDPENESIRGHGPSDRLQQPTSLQQKAMHSAVERIPPPSFSPEGGTFERPVDIKITSTFPGAKIYCTRDGSVPMKSNYAAVGASPLLIELQHSAILKCVAITEDNMCSEISCVEYGVVSSNTAGVGIVLEIQQEAFGAAFVIKQIVAGGPADRDGRLQLGDMLEKVNERSVRNMALPLVLDLIKGPQGSRVKLILSRYSFERYTGAKPASTLFSVELKRSSLPSPVARKDDIRR